jgi:hypothetical protein
MQMADADAKKYSATELAKVQVERDREDLRKLSITNDDKEGETKALNQRCWGESVAANIQDKGSAEALVQTNVAVAQDKVNQVEADRIRQVG